MEDAFEDDEGVAGPEMPLEEDPEDDEEGRFFGGGITNDTADVLDFIDEQELDGSAVWFLACTSLGEEPHPFTRSKKRSTRPGYASSL